MAKKRSIRPQLRLVEPQAADEAVTEWWLFDYVGSRRRNVIKEWALGLEASDRARLNARLDLLRQNGPNLPPNMLTDTRERKIKEIVVNGRVAIRALLCIGPVNNNSEFTLLKGAFERDRQYVPSNALKKAEARRLKVIASPVERRVPHEDVA